MKFSCPPRVLVASSLAVFSLLGAFTALSFTALSLKAAPAPIEMRDMAHRIESLDALPAAKIARGLGFNVTIGNEWEFSRAKEAGAIEARMQFDWPSVEKTAGVFVLPPKMARALDLCAQNELQPLIIAAYGPAYRAISPLVMREDVPAGSFFLPVSGDLGAVDVPRCHILQADGQHIVAQGRWAYYGALIKSVDLENQRLQLAAKTSVALPKGTVLRVNRLLYASVVTQNADDPSLVAYGRYARFLASEIGKRGLTGRVELWNEPPWIHDRWDARSGFYDDVPREINAISPNPGMLDHFLNGETPPPNVSFVWGGANKSGGRGLGARRGDLTPAQKRNVSADGLHPYGNMPESHAWDPALLRERAPFPTLALPGTNLTSNMKILRSNQIAAQNRGALYPAMSATEIGEFGPDETLRTRHNLRAFLTYLSLGFNRINFFKLADKPTGYAFIDRQTQQPLPPFVAFKALMQKIEAIKAVPAPFDARDLPAVVSYRGTFPLLTVPIVGRTRGAAKNSILMVAWQRTFPEGNGKWKEVPSPDAAPVQLRVPLKMRVVRVWNLVSGADVAFTSQNRSLNYSVSDDPIAVELAPL